MMDEEAYKDDKENYRIAREHRPLDREYYEIKMYIWEKFPNPYLFVRTYHRLNQLFWIVFPVAMFDAFIVFPLADLFGMSYYGPALFIGDISIFILNSYLSFILQLASWSLSLMSFI